jgi:CRISPR-associated protein Cmr4
MNAPQTRTLYIFTRTPLHVGAGSSVGAIDQPIQRERHTGFPIIPGSSIKGVLADLWPNEGKERGSDARWLFGSDDANKACAGALQFGEARLLAFPVRSAKGCFAWLTCPLILGRLARDAVALPKIPSFKVDQALFAKGGALALDNAIVLEDYTLTHADELPEGLAKTLGELLTGDPLWATATVKERLVVVSDDMMTHFAQTACEVAQHIRIDDETGTVAGGALFNQENVPSETLFYAPLHCFDERRHKDGDNKSALRDASQAAAALGERLAENRQILQIGADASTGLGYCTVTLSMENRP